MKKPGATDYLRQISNAVLKHHVSYVQFQTKVFRETVELQSWLDLVDLAHRIKDDIGILPEKRRKRSGIQPG